MYKRMFRRIASCIAVLLMLVMAVPAIAAPGDYDPGIPAILAEDHLYGEATVLIDSESGEILFGKNARVRMYPASTTKIMTLLLAIESGWDLNMSVRIPDEAADIPSDSSLIPVFKGETTSFGDLLYGMMLHSGNDGANAVAVLLSGSVSAFVDKMNERAEQLGCTGTHFNNAHGYHDENHYSTAYDLALITREALKHDAIRQIVSTPEYTMNVSPRGEVPLRSTNSMIIPNSSFYYEDCIGVKTGAHSHAGKCFVGAGEKDGATLITVTLNCNTDAEKWTDTERLLDYGFTRYTPHSLEQMFEMTSSRLVTTRVSNAHEDDPMGGVLQMKLAQISNMEYVRMIQNNSEEAETRALEDFSKRSQITLMDNLAAPITEGEFVGTFTYTAQDGEIITASLIAGRSIEAQPEQVTLYDVFPFLQVFENMLVRLLIVVILLLIVVLALYNSAKRRRRERRRRQIYEERRRAYLRQQRAAGNTVRSRHPSSPSQNSRRRNKVEDDLFGNF